VAAFSTRKTTGHGKWGWREMELRIAPAEDVGRATEVQADDDVDGGVAVAAGAAVVGAVGVGPGGGPATAGFLAAALLLLAGALVPLVLLHLAGTIDTAAVDAYVPETTVESVLVVVGHARTATAAVAAVPEAWCCRRRGRVGGRAGRSRTGDAAGGVLVVFGEESARPDAPLT
jgi:hypothetical protein